ncbi:MAG TPA: DUF885 domain-containing protein [Thermoanaerobaculia bacterium]|jgi:uncharacterized protein (DUF885 family)|nr:DUF885 domain-containing protein [Thermoanaerobaculia bacterium]
MKLLPLRLCLLLAATLSLPHLAAAETAAARLHDLFAREWESRLAADPLQATAVGRHEYDARLPEATVAAFERQVRQARGFLAELAAIDRTQLPAADQVDADIWKRQVGNGIADFELGLYQMPFNADSGFHSEFAQLPHLMPFATASDYASYIARLRAWPRYVDQQIALMRLGIARGFTVPRAVLAGYEGTITAYIVDDPAKSDFYPPFAHFPAQLPEIDQKRLAAEGRKAIEEGIVPGYRKFLEFYRAEYLPHARETIGAYDLPDGKAFYAHQIENFTTLALTPAEIHQLGLAEVDRITREMHAVIEKVGFKGDFPAFLQFLRSDPRFYAKTPQELLERASFIAKRMDGKLPALFKTLPRLPYTVAPVPDAIAPKYTGGRYVESPVGSTQPGTYWVNTYALPSRPFYNLEALTFHEAVPGHHLQIARSQELQDLPPFRRYSYISAFGEGWGLYSEWLGLEAGFYTDPYSNFGRLSYEIWRACRLVVDTGIHSMGWTRQQAIDYLATHTALPLHEVETETDRYISWPGQALAYKLGELKIKELRKRAERALGQGFDVREFHDVVLGSGSVPLTVLEANVDRWIGARQAGKEKSAKPAR